MPEIARRRTGEMLRTLFEVLLPVAEGMRARNPLMETEKRLTLSNTRKASTRPGASASTRSFDPRQSTL
jgi:restriction system protein